MICTDDLEEILELAERDLSSREELRRKGWSERFVNGYEQGCKVLAALIRFHAERKECER